jgi:hypothetical protein
MEAPMTGLKMPGEQTPLGTIRAVLWLGERYYMIVDEHGVVSLMPADLVEVES